MTLAMSNCSGVEGTFSAVSGFDCDGTAQYLINLSSTSDMNFSPSQGARLQAHKLV